MNTCLHKVSTIMLTSLLLAAASPGQSGDKKEKNKHLKITINGITVHDRPHDPELAGTGKIGFQNHGLPFHIRKLRISSLSSKLQPSKRL